MEHRLAPASPRLARYDGFHEGVLVKKPRMRNVENFICHNGDLDFFDVGARTYDLSAIQVGILSSCDGASRRKDLLSPHPGKTS